MTDVRKADEYRAKAVECDKLADKATDEEAKRQFREAAKNWRSVAQQAEQYEV